MEHSGVNYNYAPWQLFTVSKTTTKGATFTDEPATGKVLRAQAALTLTVSFVDATPDLAFDLVAGDVVAFDNTVLDITTTALALLA